MTLLVPGLLSTSPHKASSNCSRKGNQMMKTAKALTRLEKIGLGTVLTLENPSKLQEIIFHGERDDMNTKLWWEMCGHVVCLLLYLDQTNANCHSLFSHHSLWGFFDSFCCCWNTLAKRNQRIWASSHSINLMRHNLLLRICYDSIEPWSFY